MHDDIKSHISKYAALLPVQKTISTVEAERRAGEFLHAQSQITEWRHILSEEKIKLTSAQTAVYAQELAGCTGKTITENKIAVEANRTYQSAREDLESIDNDVAYLKAYYDIFNNAHVFYRQLAKGEQF